MKWLIVVIVLFVSPVWAEDAPPNPLAPGLTERPLTQFEMYRNLFRTFTQMGNYVQQSQVASSKIANVAGARQRHPYDRGADVSEIITNHLHDFGVVMSDFLDCLDLKWVGMCYKITWTGIKFDWYRQYRFPVQKVENVDSPLKSGYFLEEQQELLSDPLEEQLYSLAESQTSVAIGSAAVQANKVGAIVGYDYTGPGDLDQSIDAMDKLKSAYSGFDARVNVNKKDLRLRDDVDKAGVVYNEYHVMPEPTNQILGRFFFFCHDKLLPLAWASDWPIGALPARLAAWSFFLFPQEMFARFLNPLNVPQGCSGGNIRTGKTPWDMLITGKSGYDLMLLAQPTTGCQKVNAGPWVPVTNVVYSSGYHTGASAVGFQRGIKAAHKMPGLGHQFYDLDVGRDRVMWSQNAGMPSSCQKLEKYMLDYGRANLKGGKDHWNVGIHWRFFRCCKRGYKVLFGPKPIIRR